MNWCQTIYQIILGSDRDVVAPSAQEKIQLQFARNCNRSHLDVHVRRFHRYR